MTTETLANPSAFEAYMSAATILVVDDSFTYRVALKQTLVSFGVQTENIFLAKNLKEARSYIEKVKPHIVLSDFLLDDGVSTNLIETNKDFIFILVSSVATQAAVAKAAEVEVDQFIFKPYSQLHLKDVLEGVIQKKSEPSESAQYIEDGKELLSIGEFDKAAILFEHAKTDPKSFARACAYLAEIKKLKNDLDSAFKSFREGLTSSEVHFRCLIGLFNALLQSSRKEEAYSVLKDILIHFPECPERLVKALNMAVETKNFVDIEEMHIVFQFMYDKPEKLLNHMSSALLVNGHYHLKHKNQSAALESFVRGISIGKGHDKFTSYVKEKLTQYGLENKLEEVLKNADYRKTA
jgi:DNA-binding NarL/FixJ family response regulator